MVEAIESVIASLPDGIELRNCDELVVEIHQRGQLLNEVNPETILAARFSVPHIAAVAAVYGRLDSETLSPESLKDSAVVDLRQRVLVRPFEPVMPPPNDRPARVRFKFAGEIQYQAECLCARGSPSRPFSFEEIRQKVDRICACVYPDLAKVMDRLVSLEDDLLDSSWGETVSELTGGT
jgi:2-methylcitrate dehydratase PrpD